MKASYIVSYYDTEERQRTTRVTADVPSSLEGNADAIKSLLAYQLKKVKYITNFKKEESNGQA